MREYKYSQTVTGSRENLDKLSKRLKEMGYELSNAYEKDGSLKKGVINTAMGINMSGWGVMTLSNGSNRGADFEWGIDNPTNFNIVLAIAAIRMNDDFHEGEWSIYSDGGRDEMRLILPDNSKESLLGARCVLGATKTWTKNYRKATPDDIIKYYNLQKGEVIEFVLPQKWYVIRHINNAKILNEYENKKNKNEGAFADDQAYFFSDKTYQVEKKFTEGYTEITTEQFINHVLKQKITMESFKLPEKWLVRYKNREQFNKLNKWKDCQWMYYSPEDTDDCAGGSYPSKEFTSRDVPYWFSGRKNYEDRLKRGFVEITFDQFERYVLCKKKNEIIGYKAPHDLFQGAVKKDMIFRQATAPLGSYTTDDAKICNSLPKEIVELWEPVYKEVQKEEKVVLGSNKVEVVIREEIKFRDCTATIQQIEELYNRFSTFITNMDNIGTGTGALYGTYVQADVRFIRIGCNEEKNLFSLNEIKSVIDIYKKVNNVK